jgi:hypothetical protein
MLFVDMNKVICSFLGLDWSLLVSVDLVERHCIVHKLEVDTFSKLLFRTADCRMFYLPVIGFEVTLLAIITSDINIYCLR